MSAPTKLELSLATRVRQGLELMKRNGALPPELDSFIGEIFADYRQTILPPGTPKANKKMREAETKAVWISALALIKSGKKEEARTLIHKRLAPEHYLPNTSLVITVMRELLEPDDDKVVLWQQQS